MTIDPILHRSRWHKAGTCTLQVLPNPREPGFFLASVIVKDRDTSTNAGLMPKEGLDSCEHISAIQVFVESKGVPERAVPVAFTELEISLRSTVACAFAQAAAKGRLECFRIQPGNQPSEPIYPVWTRDIQRSRQAVAGRYEEITPAVFEFVPTLNCVFRCPQCAYRQPKERLGIWTHNVFSSMFHASADTMTLLLRRLQEAQVREVLFTGGGEPLLNRGTPRAMRYAYDELGLKVGLYTNGTLLTAHTARDILQAQPAYVRVSLNAGQREVYLRHHRPVHPSTGRDYASQTQSGIEHLAQGKSELGSRTVLGISYLVDPDNAGDVVAGASVVGRIAKKYPGTINYMRFTPSVDYFGPDQNPRDALTQQRRAQSLTPSCWAAW